MPEPIDPKLLDEIRHRLPHWEEMGKSGLTDSIRALLGEVDRQAVMLTNQEHTILNEYGQTADAHAEIDRLQVEVDRLRAALAEIWRIFPQYHTDLVSERSADVAERALRGLPQPAEPLSGDVTSGTQPGAEPLSSCPHVVTDEDGTSHCSLSEGRVREVERQRDIVIEAARALAEDVGTYGRGFLVGRLVEQCDRAEGKS